MPGAGAIHSISGVRVLTPPRKNAKPWKPSTAGAIARNEALRASKYLGRAIWRKWSGYHRRSRAETKMHCVKLLGQSLMARDFDRQVAELQCAATPLVKQRDIAGGDFGGSGSRA